MKNYLVEVAIYLPNVLPLKNGVSNSIGKAGIVLGRPQPYLNIKRISFGAYAISYAKTKNDMTSIGVP